VNEQAAINQQRSDLRADRNNIAQNRADIRNDVASIRTDRADIRADRNDLHQDGVSLHGTGPTASTALTPKSQLTAANLASNAAAENNKKATDPQSVHKAWYHFWW
jgi:hypothetical protein